MTWSVRTTADVVSVTAHVSAYTLPLHREKSGLFTLSFTVPSNVPGFFHGNYSLDIVAQDSAGTTATRTLPLVFQ